MARLRAAAVDCVPARAVRRVAAAVTSVDRPAETETWDAETTWLRELARSTRAARWGARAADAARRAWRTSSSHRALDQIRDGVHAMSLTERVRAAGLWATAAALTDGILTPFDPRPATLSRWAMWAGLLVLGATAAAFAGPAVAAWTEWRGRRWQ
jgi:hypothetical protein